MHLMVPKMTMARACHATITRSLEIILLRDGCWAQVMLGSQLCLATATKAGLYIGATLGQFGYGACCEKPPRRLLPPHSNKELRALALSRFC